MVLQLNTSKVTSLFKKCARSKSGSLCQLEHTVTFSLPHTGMSRFPFKVLMPAKQRSLACHLPTQPQRSTRDRTGRGGVGSSIQVGTSCGLGLKSMRKFAGGELVQWLLTESIYLFALHDYSVWSLLSPAMSS